jgi:hypothetical protein
MATAAIGGNQIELTAAPIPKMVVALETRSATEAVTRAGLARAGDPLGAVELVPVALIASLCALVVTVGALAGGACAIGDVAFVESLSIPVGSVKLKGLFPAYAYGETPGSKLKCGSTERNRAILES